ncbi:dTMP kinase [Saxibacter everestensis]|uniref:Thymidylate kinase n=1 Tax=Saxibacter everestensis TaxID=2909229 RepID=A0ABY8QWK1_9MICO|nr:dTMP kinase [Brevibacteriaceae bacterium ZFBP1038]
MSSEAGRRHRFSVALLGIDGAGKTTVARSLVRRSRARGDAASLYRHPGGRKTLDNVARRFNSTAEAALGSQGLTVIETVTRSLAVIRSAVQSRRRDGLVVFDRYIHCQIALRRMRGLHSSPFLQWLLTTLPRPDVIVFFDISPRQAHARILARGIDTEPLAMLCELDAAYRQLSDFDDFYRIDAGRPVADVVDELEAVICAAAKRKAAHGLVISPSSTIQS